MKLAVNIDVRNHGNKYAMACVWILDENNNYLSFAGDGKSSNSNASYFQETGFWRDQKWTQHWDIGKERLTFLPGKGRVRFLVNVMVDNKEVVRIVSDWVDLNAEFAAAVQKFASQNASKQSSANQASSRQTASKQTSKSLPADMTISSGIQRAKNTSSNSSTESLSPLTNTRINSINFKINKNGIAYFTISETTLTFSTGGQTYDYNYTTENDYTLPLIANCNTSGGAIEISAPGSALKTLSLKPLMDGSYRLKLTVSKSFLGDKIDLDEYYILKNNGKKVWDYITQLINYGYFN
ncbi:MAG: hypothetical protein J1F05_04615 [Muribaculaceae bacterium]|nr:hypothetical protein [Muribaculaceae bacterium]